MESYKSDNISSATWLGVEKYFRDLQGPAKRQVSHAANLAVSPDGTKIAFTGSIGQSDFGVPSLRICLLDIDSKSVEILTEGPHDDKEPQWSRDGHELFFLSDRVTESSFQLYRLRLGLPEKVEQLSFLDGSVEYFSVSSTGTRILIGLASLGSHKAGSQGSGTVSTRDAREGLADWMPTIEPLLHPTGWRSAWVYEKSKGVVSRMTGSDLNVWESSWCGESQMIALVSDTPGESAWYSARLEMIDLQDGTHSEIYQSSQQIGHATSSPSGNTIAFVEALCSDRTLVSGRLRSLNTQSGKISDIDLDGLQDVVQVCWLNETQLYVTGLQGLKTVVAEFDSKTSKHYQLLETLEGLGLKYPKIAVGAGMFAVVRESWMRYPEIAIIENGQLETIYSFEHAGAIQQRAKLGPAEPQSWLSSDGTEVEGMLYLPLHGTKPYPLILNAHGGPVYSYRDSWQGHYPYVAFLVANGYAVLNANPRGSTGRGKAFAEGIKGDFGGAEAQDLLTGVDALVDCGLADPKRLGVTGGSHGGYLAAWLVTQTCRFAAAIPRSPVTDYLEHYTTSNISSYIRLFLDGSPYSADSQFFTTSPLRSIDNCNTPVLQIVGSEDRCVAPAQAR